MTPVIYFGEMLVASLLAILLLVISHFRMSSDAALFVGGVIGWTFAEYLRPSFDGLSSACDGRRWLLLEMQAWLLVMLPKVQPRKGSGIAVSGCRSNDASCHRKGHRANLALLKRHGKAALAALADTMHLVQHLIVFLYIRLECLLVKANIATTSSASANSASGRRG
jgi:hypothetical protein